MSSRSSWARRTPPQRAAAWRRLRRRTPGMALHFTVAELHDRIGRTLVQVREACLQGLLVFRQESMYWLTGYDTAGYSQFQCLWFGADGRLVLLTRSSDVRQAHATS